MLSQISIAQLILCRQASRQKSVEQASTTNSGDGEEGEKVARARSAHSFNFASSNTRGEIGAVRQNLNMNCGAAGAEDNSNFNGAGGWALEVVGVTARRIVMEGRLHSGGAVIKRLEDVEFTASRLPARAGGVSVLESARDLGIEHPNGRHIAFEATLSVHWHGKLEHEDLIRAGKAI
jgi:hypothetical protein